MPAISERAATFKVSIARHLTDLTQAKTLIHVTECTFQQVITKSCVISAKCHICLIQILCSYIIIDILLIDTKSYNEYQYCQHTRFGFNNLDIIIHMINPFTKVIVTLSMILFEKKAKATPGKKYA